MRKIGMVVAAAAVVSYAGAARAQTTEQIIEATATIQSVMSLVENDGLFECGVVSGFGTVSTTCADGDPTAQVAVTANQNWLLAIEDLFVTGDQCSSVSEITPLPSEGGADVVTLCNASPGANGFFVIALDYANGCFEATIPADGDTAVGTSAEDCTIDIVEDLSSGTSISGLDSHDGFGVYEGTFTVTLSPDA